MNGGADLGGMMGFGPVIDEINEPNFHEAWEARVLGMTVALGTCGLWNIDQGRFARESMQPADYMKSSYYEIWLHGILSLLQEREMVSTEELSTGNMSLPPVSIKRKLVAKDVLPVLLAGGPADRPGTEAAAFEQGQTVRTINTHPQTHTRLPRYARDKIGIVTKVHGIHVYPDSSAQGLGESPTWLYQIKFTARTLWGDSRNDRDTVTLDLWQPYLRAV